MKIQEFKYVNTLLLVPIGYECQIDQQIIRNRHNGQSININLVIRVIVEMENYTKLKDKGNQLFKEKKFEESIKTFETAISLIDKNQKKQDIIDSTELGKIYVILNINAAFAALNLKSSQFYIKAQQLCSKALSIDKKNQKALYRRGLAYKQYGELLQVESNGTSPYLVELYSKAKVDLQDLIVLDKNNDLAKQKLTQTVKDIYRITVQQGKQVDFTSGNTAKTQTHKTTITQVEQKKESAKVTKKGSDMKKILQDYRIQEVTSMAREKVQHQYLTQQLPKSRAELEKALRQIQKSSDVFLKFVYRMTDEYLKRIQPTFDMLFQIVNILLKFGEGEQAKSVIATIRTQKAFDLLWKSYSSGEKKQFRQKWVALGLNESDIN